METNTVYDRLVDVLRELKNEISMCPLCEKILLNQYFDSHMKRYHRTARVNDDLQV